MSAWDGTRAGRNDGEHDLEGNVEYDCEHCGGDDDQYGGTVSTGDGGDEVAEFAALLTELKERTGRSYGSLARRLGMNTSTLHRYCAGEAVPQDFAPVERLAEFSGATPEERLELHRRWLRAVAVRQAARPRAAATTEPGTAATQTGPVDEAEAGGAEAEGAVGSVGGPPRPWYGRRRTALLAAVTCALLATLGTLSALPADRPSSASPPSPSSSSETSVSAPARTTAPAAPRPSSTASPSRSPSPTPGGASPTPGTPEPPAPGGSTPEDTTVPLTWTADSQVWALGCSHDYVVVQPPARVPPPPAAQDAAPWAAAQGAVHGRETDVEIAVQGRSSTAVVLTALRVRVVGRGDPAPGNVYAMDQGCGGSISPRYFAVDLDRDRPIARPVAGNDTGTPIPAVRMPYRVSATDPEVLLVTARTEGCDCSWYLELDWSSEGRTGTVRIDDHGRPFRTRSITGLPRYMYDTSARRWAPYQ
ncbi:helix-turn-helix domain-containing protein [Streptomyces phaeoluteigriseus]|uniref:helix-turn-helix domain-containing protein n=1 Tax=Streptomyces phaeoluteigriseus TaxID=114686 RepID=UPI000B8C7937|nr:helix-turn-helix transcriptional regulator [Streptomyces phaeoluteigriseus]